MFMIHDVTSLNQLKRELKIKQDIKDSFACMQQGMKVSLSFISAMLEVLAR